MKDWFLGHRDWCMSILRAYLGIGLFIKGIDFVRNKDELLRVMEENDVFWTGTALAHVIILTHLFGGLLAIGRHGATMDTVENLRIGDAAINFIVCVSRFP